MGMNIAQVNNNDVIKLADLMQQKEILVRDMRNAVKRLVDNKLFVNVQLTPTDVGRATVLRDDNLLQKAIDSQSEWIIDRVYDTAIHNLEKEILVLSEKVMKNLINSHKPY